MVAAVPPLEGIVLPGASSPRLQVNSIGADVAVDTRRPVVVEGFKTYQATGLGGADSGCGSGGSCDVADQNGVLFTDAAAFMANAGAIVNRLGLTNSIVQVRPGIEVDSTGDLTLDNTTNTTGVWDLSAWNAALGAPVNVALRATGNLIFNVSLTDGFTNTGGAVSAWTFGESGAVADSGAYRLTAGADLSAANPLAVIPQPVSATTGTPNTGNVIVTPGNLIRTGDGSIAIEAGGDLLLGYAFNGYSNGELQVTESDPLKSVIYTAGVPLTLSPAEQMLFTPPSNAAYPTMGGDLTVGASDDLRSAPSLQLVSDWLWRRGAVAQGTGTLISPDKNATWWVVFKNFEQGIGALGGGNVSLNAQGDIVNVSAVIPTTGQLLGAAGSVPSAANVVLTGGGRLQVHAGANIESGVFEDDWGNAGISSGASMTSGTTLGTLLTGLNQSNLTPEQLAAPIFPILVMGEGDFEVSARSGANVNLVANSTTLPYTTANLKVTHGAAYFYTYGTDSTLGVVSSGGDIVLSNDSSNLPIGSNRQCCRPPRSA